MKIICPIGKGTLEHEECLKCSLAEPPECGYGYSLLSAIYRHEDQDRRNEVHVTDITGCLRKSFYDKDDPAPELVSDKLVRFLGVAVHGGIEHSDEHVDAELSLSGSGIVGRSDIVFKNGILMDIKTTRWMTPSRLPYGSHELQVNIYAHLLRKQGRDINRLFIQYVDMSGPTKCRRCNVIVQMVDGALVCPKCLTAPREAHLGALLVEIHIMPEEEIESIINHRTNVLKFAMTGGNIPDAEPGFLCNYCSNRDLFRCPEGLNQLG